MTPELSNALMQTAIVIIFAIGGGIGVIIRVSGKRFERREAERAAAVKLEQQQRNADLTSEIERIKLESERNKQTVAQNGELVKAILDLAHMMQEQTGIQSKSLETISDYGKVLSANSSVLVGNTEELGELVERTGAVRDDISKLDKAVKKIEDTVNDLKIAIGETGNVSVITRLNNIQSIVEELKAKPLEIVSGTLAANKDVA